LQPVDGEGWWGAGALGEEEIISKNRGSLEGGSDVWHWVEGDTRRGEERSVVVCRSRER